MKKWISISACLAIFTIFSGCEQEESNDSITKIHVTDFIGHAITDADVYLYENEQDYLKNTNAVSQGKVNFLGTYNYKTKKEKFFWVRAIKGDLNNIRSCNKTEPGNGCGSRFMGSEGPGISAYVYLSRTPTKLHLRVYDAGAPVNEAEVQLFLSEEDYINNVEPYYSAVKESVHMIKKSGKTDNEGYIYFDNLEPRQYWFKIKKGNKNNSTTIFKTPNVLEDNPDITNSFDVGIK